jgi:lysozyme family protein
MAAGNFRACLETSTWRPDFDWQYQHPDAAEFPVATKDDFAALYQAKYWNPLRCETLPKGLDLMVFDFGVNCGIGASARQLQTVLHRGNVKVAIDGSIGPMTVNETLRLPLGTLITQTASQHLRYYQGLAYWPLYGRGWTNRNNTRLDLALKMAGLKE